MSKPFLYRIDSVSVWDLNGSDAAAILHNLTTNEIKDLSGNEGRESFVTDVRGKTLGHGFVYRTENCFRMIGASGQSEGLTAHADRYTIREDATPSVHDADYVAFAVSAEHFANLVAAIGTKLPEDTADDSQGRKISCDLGGDWGVAYQVEWIGKDAWVVLVPKSNAADFEKQLAQHDFDVHDEALFHDQRIAVGFPWYGIDITEKNLPQEADRNAQTISFTKGCYLGQETVARLDALGQVQKQLVQWSVKECVPPVGTELVADGKTVGKLLSVAKLPNRGAIAIGMARRSHFDPGATATGVFSAADGATDVEFSAIVQEHFQGPA